MVEAIASLIATYDDTDDAIQDSAASIGRHLEEARQMLGSCPTTWGRSSEAAHASSI
jgi:hypothetical protein